MSLSGCISTLSSDDKADRFWIDLAEPAIEDFPQFVVGSDQAKKEEIVKEKDAMEWNKLLVQAAIETKLPLEEKLPKDSVYKKHYITTEIEYKHV